MDWECVVGLETHVQLKTASKIFSGSSTAFGADANTQVSLVDAALPGVLPVMNREAVAMAVRFGLAVDATINRRSIFARKNYFYPDLPKGYQISQYEIPIVSRGRLEVATGDAVKTIGITRAHLEEDAGKSLHEDFQGMTGIDLNRAGTPLLEVVSEPDMRSAAEAVAYLRSLRVLVRYLGICDGNMQEGSFRCDANVSVRRRGATRLGVRTELKNINSFRFIEKAIEFETLRQIEVLENGGAVTQETRLYDPDKDETRPMRGKEEAHDYRYFPDPDLPPLVLDDDFIEAARAALPELPDARLERFRSQYGLGVEEARALTADPHLADYFESAARAARGDARVVSNWVTGELAARLNRESLDIADSAVGPEALAGLLDRVADGTISGKIAKQVFAAMWESGDDADRVIESRGLRQIADPARLEAIVDEVLAGAAAQVEQYRNGRHKVLGFLVGQVMQKTRGKANPGQVNEILKRRLERD